jgi:hypothetical protein
MPRYRLVFPPPPGSGVESSPTSEIDSGDVVYEPGDTLWHDGKLWQVSQAPVETPMLDEVADLMVWPAEA